MSVHCRYMNAEKYNLDRIYFGGCFIRGAHLVMSSIRRSVNSDLLFFIFSRPGHAATIATLSYAIRFWSKGTKRALFLRHEGFLSVQSLPRDSSKLVIANSAASFSRGSIGAWIRNIDSAAEQDVLSDHDSLS
jgi:pantothenate kinase